MVTGAKVGKGGKVGKVIVGHPDQKSSLGLFVVVVVVVLVVGDTKGRDDVDN